jgi:hypothetical protein
MCVLRLEFETLLIKAAPDIDYGTVFYSSALPRFRTGAQAKPNVAGFGLAKLRFWPFVLRNSE